MTTNNLSETNSKKPSNAAERSPYFDRITTGIGYVGRTRNFKTAGMRKPKWAATINGFYGPTTNREYASDDMIVVGEHPLERIEHIKSLADSHRSLIVEYVMGDSQPTYFLQKPTNDGMDVKANWESVNAAIVLQNKGRWLNIHSACIDGTIEHFRETELSQQGSAIATRTTRSLGYLNAIRYSEKQGWSVMVSSFFGEAGDTWNTLDIAEQISPEVMPKVQELYEKFFKQGLAQGDKRPKVVVGYITKGGRPSFYLKKKSKALDSLHLNSLDDHIQLYNKCCLDQLHFVSVDSERYRFDCMQESDDSGLVDEYGIPYADRDSDDDYLDTDSRIAF